MFKWNNVKDKLPENEKDVLVCAKRKYYNSDKYIRFIVKAFYTDGKHNTEDSNYVWDNCNFEYDGKADAYIIPEGWWEAVDYTEEFGMIEDLTQAKACDGSFVTHWAELPELPADD